MLKYIGDFDKLKDYGFKNKTYRSKENIDEWLFISDDGTIHYEGQEYQFGIFPMSLETMFVFMLLIKDGLVVKE